MFSQKWADTESHVTQLLSTMTSVDLLDGGARLRITSPADTREFVRHVATRPAPATKVNF